MKFAIVLATVFAFAFAYPVEPCPEDNPMSAGMNSGVPKSLPVQKRRPAPPLTSKPVSADPWHREMQKPVHHNSVPMSAPTQAQAPLSGPAAAPAWAPPQAMPSTPSPSPSPTPTSVFLPGSSVQLPNVNASANGNRTLSMAAEDGHAALAGNGIEGDTIMGQASSEGRVSGILANMDNFANMLNPNLLNPSPVM